MWLNLAVLLFGLGGGSAPAQSGLDSSAYGECGPGGSRTLKLDVSVDPTIVVPTGSQEREPPAPHTSTVRVTLTNPGPTALRLTFPNPCFLGYRVETMDGGDLAQEDGEVCAAALRAVTLPSGGKETKEFRWTARSWHGAYAPLRPGKYRIVGTLAKRYCGREGQEEPPLQTAPVFVEVRPAAK